MIPQVDGIVDAVRAVHAGSATEPAVIPVSRMRQAITRSMNASAQIPQFAIEMEANLRALSETRKQLAADGASISYSDALIAATAMALVEYPTVNASLDADRIVLHPGVNIGVAVSLDDGLIAPAVIGADQLSLTEIRDERVRLTEMARAGRLTAEEMTSATFTISNLGPLGVRRFQALVVPPQVAIVAVGGITEDLRLSLTLSCDHRVLDGAPAAEFLGSVVGRLEACEWVAAQFEAQA